jgi:DNA-binding transcriptional regulator YiaG
MNGEEFRATIKKVGMTQVEAAEFFGVNESSCRRWISGKYPIPKPVAVLLRMMDRKGLTPENVQRYANQE